MLDYKCCTTSAALSQLVSMAVTAGSSQAKVLQYDLALRLFGHADAALDSLNKPTSTSNKYRFKIACAKITVFAKQQDFQQALQCYATLKRVLHLLPTNDANIEFLSQVLTEAALSAIDGNNDYLGAAIDLLQSASEHARHVHAYVCPRAQTCGGVHTKSPRLFVPRRLRTTRYVCTHTSVSTKPASVLCTALRRSIVVMSCHFPNSRRLPSWLQHLIPPAAF